MGRVGSIVEHATWCLLCLLLVARGSEFPERECCDPIYPLIPELDAIPIDSQTTTISSASSPSAIGEATAVIPGRSGELLKVKQYSFGMTVRKD
jgi:hypothetical protein